MTMTEKYLSHARADSVGTPKYIDMHTHSTASDGTLSPKELVRAAKDAGLSAVALSDHDTGDGLLEFEKEAASLGIEPIPAIELSCDAGCEVHILGYYVDCTSQKFLDMAHSLAAFRRIRMETTSRLLRENGINVSPDEAYSFASGKICGRLHFAKAMVEKGYVKDVSEAFDKYLSSGGCAYSPSQRFTPKEAVEALASMGAAPVLAHPKLMRLSDSETVSVISSLKNFGLRGIECFHSSQDEAYSLFLLDTAKRLGLKVTGGSDFHGENKPDVFLGRACGGKRIPYSVLEKFIS